MAKTSSSKKVARVARSGSSRRRVRERPKIGFGLAIAVIIVLGTVSVGYARTQRIDVANAAEAPAANKDHWHVAYGIYVCNHFLPPLTDKDPTSDPNGIHTHGDGIIHTHPFNQASAGSNARLKVFADDTNLKLGKDSFTTPDGTEYKNGYDCDGKPAKVLAYRWADALDPNSTAEVFDKNFGDIKLKDDRSAITLAVVPEGTDVPRPESITTLNNLSDVQGQGADAQGGSTATLPPGVSIPGQATTGAPTDASTPGAAPSGANPATPASPAPSVSTPAAPTPATP